MTGGFVAAKYRHTWSQKKIKNFYSNDCLRYPAGL